MRYTVALTRDWEHAASEKFSAFMRKFNSETNARGDYKYQFARNIQRDIQLRHAHNRQRAARELRAEFIKFTAPSSCAA